jgi:hypothetical protein
VLIVNWIDAEDPDPEYSDVTWVLTVPYDELVPGADTKAQESKLQDPGKLKYCERATAAKVY